MGLLDFFQRSKPVQNKDVRLTTKQTIVTYIRKRQLERDKATIEKWVNAVQFAEDVRNPDRSELVRMIREVERDPHLVAVMSARKNPVLATPFQVCKADGEVDERATDLLAAEWFQDLVSLALDSIFYGFSVIQLDEIINDKFQGAELVPREYIVPEKLSFKKDVADRDLTPFDEKPFDKWVVWAGNKFDLGLIAKVFPLLVYKKDVLAAWSEYADVFGMPTRIGRTDLMNDKKRENAEDMVQNMGAFGWAVLDKEDDLELVESNNRDAFQVFQQMVQTVDAQVSKMVLGQTGTTDEKSFAGSAEVHERVFNLFSQADRRFIVNLVNRRVLPLMVRHGLIGPDLYFEFVDEENQSLEEKKNIVKDLAPYFQFDVEELTETFGFTFTEKAPQAPQFLNKGSYLSQVDNYYQEALRTIQKKKK